MCIFVELVETVEHFPKFSKTGQCVQKIDNVLQKVNAQIGWDPTEQSVMHTNLRWGYRQNPNEDLSGWKIYQLTRTALENWLPEQIWLQATIRFIPSQNRYPWNPTKIFDLQVRYTFVFRRVWKGRSVENWGVSVSIKHKSVLQSYHSVTLCNTV